jgi:hypothetical protein
MKSWLQLNDLWHLVSSQKKKPAAKPQILNSKGQVISKAVDVDEDKLERWEIKAERTAGALKTCMSHNVKVLIQDYEDDPILIWDTLKMSFIQQWTAPCFNAYHALLSVKKSDSEALDSLINRVDEQIRVIKSLSPSSFTLNNLYDDTHSSSQPPSCPTYALFFHLCLTHLLMKKSLMAMTLPPPMRPQWLHTEKPATMQAILSALPSLTHLLMLCHLMFGRPSFTIKMSMSSLGPLMRTLGIPQLSNSPPLWLPCFPSGCSSRHMQDPQS